MTLSSTKALDLMKEHGLPDNIIRHCIHTSKIALFLAKKLVAKGVDIDVDLVESAALVHDIDKLITTNKNHGIVGARILDELGEHKIADIIKKHSVACINIPERMPCTWEEKLVYYADKREDDGKLVSIGKRTGKWIRQHGHSAFFDEAFKRLKALEDEIFGLLDFAPDRLEAIMKKTL